MILKKGSSPGPGHDEETGMKQEANTKPAADLEVGDRLVVPFGIGRLLTEVTHPVFKHRDGHFTVMIVINGGPYRLQLAAGAVVGLY